MLNKSIIKVKNIVEKKVLDDPKKVCINIGGGNVYQKGWKNLDILDGVFVDYPNINLFDKNKFPFDDETVDIFFTSHCFEHLKNDIVMHVLSECYRALKPSGVMRIIVPNMDIIYDKFLQKDKGFFRYGMIEKDRTMEEHFLAYVCTLDYKNTDISDVWDNILDMGKEEFLEHYSSLSDMSLIDERHSHCNWFTFSKLFKMLSSVGFVDIEKSVQRGSRCSELRQQGIDSRGWFSLFVEGVK